MSVLVADSLDVMLLEHELKLWIDGLYSKNHNQMWHTHIAIRRSFSLSIKNGASDFSLRLSFLLLDLLRDLLELLQ